MAYPFFTLTNKVPLVGFDPAGTILEPLVAGIPLPVGQIEDLGAFVSADTTAVVAGNVERDTTVRVTCPTPATVTPVLDVDAGFAGVNVTFSGQGYVRPPAIVPVEPGADFFNTPNKGASFQAYLKIVAGEGGITKIAGGAGYSAQTIVGAVGGLPPGIASDIVHGQVDGTDDFLGTLGFGTRTVDPPSVQGPNTEACVNFVTVLEGGENYSASTVIMFLGAEPSPGGRPPFGFPIIKNGVITGVQMVDPGARFVAPLQATAFDPTGAGRGAELSVSMMRGRPAQLSVSIVGGHVTAVNVLDAGDGYVTVPQIGIFDPTGAGSGAVFTVDAVPGGAPAQMGLSRVDVLAQGALYEAGVTLTAITRFEAAYFVSLSEGNLVYPGGAFRNLMRTSIQQLVATQVTESIS